MNVAAPWSSETPFVGYAYAYPHKSAYRLLPEPCALRDAWADERRDALFLYFHIPFCEYRCGFCNLFTLANGHGGLVQAYLKQLRREAEVIRDAMPDARFARLAIGGGTPTFLQVAELEELLAIARDVQRVDPTTIPASCEASPATLDAEKAKLLRQFGVDRLSLGVQTFDDDSSGRMGRPQRAEEARRAIGIARAAGFPVLNLDLIYGEAGQSVSAWMRTVDEAARTGAEEIFLYPLYVRELTGLGRTGAAASDNRLDCFRAARALLLGAGYEQHSFRMFRRAGVAESPGPAYCCQSDGMVGVGCGARSYTRSLHYSTEFAVGRAGVRSILLDYLNRGHDELQEAHYGFQLDQSERRRRYVIQGLLQTSGVSLSDYETRHGAQLFTDLPELADLTPHGLADVADDRLRLTDAGLELSDAIGPWLYSPPVRKLMEEFTCH